MAGHEPPTKQEGVRAVLRGIRRTIGSAKQGKAPATAELLGADARAVPGQLAGKRDRALLCWASPGRSGGVNSARSRSPISPRSPTDCGS